MSAPSDKFDMKCAAALQYLESVIAQDFDAPLDELTSLMFMLAGPMPAAKPYSVVSIWKNRARWALIHYTKGKPAHPHVARYVGTVVLYLCRRAGHKLSGSSLPGWEIEYMRQIKAGRKDDEDQTDRAEGA